MGTGIVIWIVLCIIIGIAGKDKRIGGGGAFFLSLILSPLVGLIIVLLSKPKDSTLSNSTPISVLTFDGSERVTSYDRIGVGDLYIQKHPVSGKFEVRAKEINGGYDVKGEFEDYAIAKQFIRNNFKGNN